MSEREEISNQQAIWADREARWQYRLALVQKWNLPVGTLTLNIPGSDKHLPGSDTALFSLGQCWRRCLDAAGLVVAHAEQRTGADGLSLHLVVCGSALQVKRCAVEVESLEPLGRLADADVLDAGGTPIGREQLALAPRRCLLCERPAVLCIREGRHASEDVARYVRDLLELNDHSSGMTA